ncbi:MAG TPA: hypothetical protein VGL35_02100 [Rhizomicrobium sp.]|jgi:hypothetical protein
MRKDLSSWLVVTTCTASKRSTPGAKVAGLQRGAQADVAKAWVEILKRQKPQLPAIELYRGRAFGLAKQAAADIAADFGVISAGLGYVTGTLTVPAYDITVRPKASSSVREYVERAFDPGAWWNAMSKGPFAADFKAELASHAGALLCLSKDYADMVAADLVAVARTGAHLRIFGLSVDKHLPAELRRYVLPYDERLSKRGLSGTRVDFPQRALADYVQNIFGSYSDLEIEREAVLKRLAAVTLPKHHKIQRRLSDDEVRSLILEASATVGKSRSRLLAHLRHARQSSCEQGRFFRLCNDVFGGRP